jgi:hypothetical protein
MMQNRMHAEQREWNYQLRHEEMVIMCEELHVQHNMMTTMMMAMLQRYVGENGHPPP